jgi:hypothetical protein
MGGKYKTEIYQMNGPEEAFGIFSISKYKCRSMPSIASYACQTLYQLQICSGPYYISIINATGTKTDSVASLKIGEAIIHKITESSVNLSTYLPDIPAESIKNNAILVKGKLGIMNGAPDWEDYFKGATGYCVVIFRVTDKTILSVRFQTQDDLSRFVALHNINLENVTSSPVESTGSMKVSKISNDHLLIVFKN